MSIDILANQAAFLTMIEHAEGTGFNPHTKQKLDPYRTCFGYVHTIRNFSDHPTIIGEWRGEILPDHLCRKVGLKAGCKSTAAGRYQIIRPTWQGCKTRLRLPDFGPASQDKAALYLIDNEGALVDVHAGHLQTAIAKCSRQWASLPGSTSGQRMRKVDELVAAFQGAGGALA
jgi:muramidase (phage lysozyme)